MILLGALASLSACASGPTAPSAISNQSGSGQAVGGGPVSLIAQDWTTISAPSSFPLVNDAAGRLMFTFPAAPNSINYLYTRVTWAISDRVIISVAVSTTGAPVFNYQTETFNTCTAPAHARPFFWAHNNSNSDNDRWWANPVAFALAGPASTTLTIPLTPDRWSNVSGQFGTTNPAAFAAALSAVSSLGLTFGGGCFFGHGVNVSGGSAVFSISEYRAQ